MYFGERQVDWPLIQMRLKPSLHNILVSFHHCLLGSVCSLCSYFLDVIYIHRVSFRVLEWGLSKWHFRGWLNLMSLSSEDVLVCCSLMTEATPSDSTNFSTHRSETIELGYFQLLFTSTRAFN